LPCLPFSNNFSSLIVSVLLRHSSSLLFSALNLLVFMRPLTTPS
jgi:hypothetical protein